jgi:chemotaxis protein histidine kinase CheA
MEPLASHAASPDLTAALERLWAKFLPELRERVAILESSAHAVAAGSLTAAQQDEAQSAAHKLAGVLGTFNLERGTELARELELLYEQMPDPSTAPRLAQRTSELHFLIDHRK